VTAAQSKQLKRGLVVGPLTAITFGIVGLATGSFAAWAITLAGALMTATSVFFLRLEVKARR
jgi:hypothetical protein